jgi:uncharacterized protein
VSKARTPARHVHRAKDPEQPFVVRKSRISGKGAFATRRIRKGQRIIEYLGERITHKEADRRYDDEAMSQHHTFLFAIDGTHVIDAAVRGNDARFINHSCEPNCEAIDEDGHIFIEAIRHIGPGTELTYDYQFERDEDGDMDESRYPCFCGTPSCRGTILAPVEKAKKAKKADEAKKGKKADKAKKGKKADKAKKGKQDKPAKKDKSAKRDKSAKQEKKAKQGKGTKTATRARKAARG